MATNNSVDVGLSGSTGTGAFVGDTAPTIAAPIINDSNGNKIFDTFATPSAVDYWTLQNNSAGVGPKLIATTGGGGGSIPANILGTGLAGVNLLGFRDGTQAAAGFKGQLLTSAFASAVAMTSGVATQIQSLTLTPGDWDVYAVFATGAAVGTTTTLVAFCLSLTSAVVSAPSSLATSASVTLPYAAPSTNSMSASTSTLPIAVASNTTIYLNATVIFATSTLTGNGIIIARRIN
jgi:hypothetical protein